MKNKNIMIGILGLIIVLTMASVFAIDGYCFKRVGNGQSVPANIVAQTKHMICDGVRCTVRGLSSDYSFLQICTDSKGYYASYTNCATLCAGSSIGGTEENLTMVAIFPFENNGVFIKQTFFMDIMTNKISSISMIDMIKGTTMNLCPNCASYKKPMTFRQGKNQILLRAVRGNEVIEKEITFFIDNIKPRISKSFPAIGKYAKGDFTIVYDEANVVKVDLMYGDQYNPLVISTTSCESGKAKNCTINANLTDFEGSQIYYWFQLYDVAGNSAKSKPIKVSVDNTVPYINSFDYTRSGNYITFKLGITERNFDKVIYYDNFDIKPKILCSGTLKNSQCSSKVVFRNGEHDVRILVLDKAGNTATQNVNFII